MLYNKTQEIIQEGIQTFMKAEYVSVEKADQFDVAFMGIPYDFGASYRRGARLGPKTVREHSYWDDVLDADYYNCETDEFISSKKLKLCDVGDIHISPHSNKDSFDEIQKQVTALKKKTFPVIVGGDHSIAYATIKGIKDALPKEIGDNMAILHLDAHLDMENEFQDFPPVFHGNPFSKLMSEGIIKGSHHYAVGIRGIIPKYLYDFVQKNGVHLFTIATIQKLGFEKFIQNLIKELSQYSCIYVTIDIDSITPTEVRGTGTPMEGGLTVNQVEQLLRSLSVLKLAGLELVEIAPEYDQSGFTSVVACNLLWQFLSFGLRHKV